MSVSRLPLIPGGLELSRLIYGTWRLKNDPEGFAPAHLLSKVEACLSEGITTFDLADIYGSYECESIVGAALRQAPGLRPQIEIVTKCDIVTPAAKHANVTTNHYNATAEYILASVERTLTHLGTDVIDLLLIHRPDWLTPAEETARGLDTAIRQGKIRHAGVSNFSPHQFSLLQSRMEHPLVTNQIELSLFRMEPIHDGTLAQCEQLYRHPMAWSPLGGGRLFSKDDPTAIRIRDAAASLAPRYHNATVDQLVLAWILALPSKPLIVLGTNKKDRLRAAANASNITLAREDWYALWSAAQGRSGSGGQFRYQPLR